MTATMYTLPEKQEAEELSIYGKIAIIQSKLKAPKSKFNSYANFNYRSLEDILEAVKPLLKEQDLFMAIHDRPICIAGRYWIRATVYVRNIKNRESVTVDAYAREAENKTKMDDAQVTGMASTYARKYALNGLFLIDDSQDPDDMKPEDKKPEQKITMKTPAIEIIKDLPKPKPDQVLYAQIWAKIMASKDINELAVQARRIKENEQLLDAEMIEKLTKAGMKKKKEFSTTNKVT